MTVTTSRHVSINWLEMLKPRCAAMSLTQQETVQCVDSDVD